MKEIPLSRGMVAMVDDADFAWLSKWRWHCDPLGYARTMQNKRPVLMHRLIMGVADSAVDCDHANQNKADNRRSNLRTCGRGENMANVPKKTFSHACSSRFKGVNWMARASKWRAYIGVAKKQVHLGLFTDESKAAKAYDEAAKKYFGEFACLNF
jgi:hypothetical protein